MNFFFLDSCLHGAHHIKKSSGYVKYNSHSEAESNKKFRLYYKQTKINYIFISHQNNGHFRNQRVEIHNIQKVHGKKFKTLCAKCCAIIYLQGQ